MVVESVVDIPLPAYYSPHETSATMMADKIGIQTEIELLSALERREVVTQPALAKRLSISVGMVNALLKRAVRKGLVKAKAAPYKRWAYYVTPEGFQEKSRLVAQYLDTSLAFFRMARREYRLLFARMGRGQATAASSWWGAARSRRSRCWRHLRRTPNWWGSWTSEANADRLHGLPVLRSLDEAEAWDALVITESRHPQEAFERLRGTVPERQVLAPPFLRIVREAPGFRAAGGGADRGGPMSVSMSRWYVVHTRPHQERRAEANLLRQGFRVWLPVMERSRRHARRIETVRGALFPGYLFVESGYRSAKRGARSTAPSGCGGFSPRAPGRRRCPRASSPHCGTRPGPTA